MRNWWIRMMQGRYGVYGADALSKFMMIVSLVLLVLGRVAGVRLAYSLGLVLLVLSYVRLFSRNVQARYRENELYLQKKAVFLQKLHLNKQTLAQRKTHHIYRCPSCGQKIRIPRGKGKVEIRCPKCNAVFVKHAF